MDTDRRCRVDEDGTDVAGRGGKGVEAVDVHWSVRFMRRMSDFAAGFRPLGVAREITAGGVNAAVDAAALCFFDELAISTAIGGASCR